MSLPPPIVQTATRTRSLTTPKSDITVVPFPPENPTLAVIRTSGQIGIPLPHNLPNIPAYQAWSGIPISTSFREQAMKTFENIRACLALAAATPRDITKMTVYLEARLDRKRTVQLDEAMGGFLTDDKGDVHRPACTILNVNGLSGEAGRVKIMVEVEAVVRSWIDRWKTSSEWDRSQSSDSERSSLRDTKSAAYGAVNYVTILETKGCFMRPSQDGLAPEDIQLCERLISQPVETPRDTLFEPQFVGNFHDTLQNRSEARLLVDLHPLLIPSAENQYIRGKNWLKDVVDGYNDPWVKTEPIYGPKPQPDHARGLKWSTFSQSQRRKLGITPEEKSPYTAREDMYFPYLTAEIKCGNQALDLADRQNMHSMCIALRAVVTLAQAAGCVETVHRRVLGFSISHELEGLRIYGYYPEIDGGQASFFRWPVARFDVWERGNEWVCYRFMENLDRTFLPIHTKRLMGFLEKITDPEDDSVRTEAADIESQSVRTHSQERPGFRRTASSQARGLQAELRSMVQTLQMQLEQQKLREEERDAERKAREDKLMAELEQQKLREEQREAERKAREDKLVAEQKAREDKLMAELEQQKLEQKAREDRLLALLERK